jgi:hypothetical protein
MVASFTRGERREGKKVKTTISLISLPLMHAYVAFKFFSEF